MNNQYNILIDFVGALLVCVIFMTQRRQKRRGDPFAERLLHYLMACCTLLFAADIPGLLFDGHIFPGASVLLWIADTFYWLLQIIYCWLWLLFADYWSFSSKAHLKSRRVFYAAPMIAEVLLIITTPLTGWVFTIDSANVYIRGSLYLWNMLPYVFYIAAAIVVTVSGLRRSTDPERKRRCIALVIYMFLPVCGVLLDAFVYGISWVWPMVALSLLMVYMNVQQQTISEEQLSAAKIEAELAEKQLAATKLEAELTENRVAIMLSQIQPHFLYNALNSIQCLCHDDSATAEKATADFSEFLRGNMDSLTMDKPISFARELEHTKHYLSLELLRFPDKLTVEYDIQTTLFRLPTLTLQPIVENAVRYGVTKKLEGGIVKISTRETGDTFTVTVEDTGAGFDPMRPHNDGRTHIGIQNVRDRLARMSGGTLEIKSTPGVGTVAVITVPKEAVL